jgi:hypothetical protein
MHYLLMFLLQRGSKKYNEESLKVAEIQHQKNKSLECTQLAGPLGTTCGPLVDKHCSSGLL